MESRWLRWIGTGVIAIVAVGSVASTAVGAGQRPWPPGSCPDEPGSRADAARSAASTGLGDLRSQPWFRQDPHLDRTGALQGQRLALGLDGARSSWLVDLPAESFAAGPFGRVVLVGSDDGTTSRLEALDVAGECAWPVGQETADVIRRATLDPTGTTVYDMRVDRATRADLGVWARPLDGSLPAVQIIEPIASDERFGRTWSTEFTWDLSGDRLAIQSCGEAACRTRVYDPSGGPLRVVSDPDLGTLVGLSGDALVTYAACPGLPCPVLAVDVDTAERRTLTDAAAVAVLAATIGGPRLVHEVLGEAGVSVRAVNLDGSGSVDLGPIRDDLRLHAAPSVGQTATIVPPGWVLIGPEGRLPAGGPDGRTELRHVPDGSAVQLLEVAR
jgi:hypothetical protein